MKHEQFGKPIIAIVNSFTQFVPGHTHLHEIGQIVKKEIEAMGCSTASIQSSPRGVAESRSTRASLRKCLKDCIRNLPAQAWP